MLNHMLFGEPIGQSWLQLSELALAFVLSALIGLEREIRQKSAGLRTYTLVGVSSALIMLVSKYGFTDVLENGRVVLDPSRVAAQIVSGIGFIGGGVIFVRKDLVRGLTTASIVAHGRNRHGGGRRPPDPGHRRDLRPFHRGIHLSGDRA
jgi:putative Mg2+ transporter-C (MgtC) family protein